MPTQVKIGTTFRSPFADSNPKWMVTASIGKGVWDCLITGDNPDYAGTTRSFRTRDIADALRWDNAISNTMAAHDKWWSAQMVGTTVHYHNGFQQFVRGEIAINAKGEKVMRPTALVGAWRDYDLPRFIEDGSIAYGYYAKRIITQDYQDLQPNYTNMYESPGYRRGTGTNLPSVDPRDLTPLDLTPPPMTTDQAHDANIVRVLNHIVGIAQDRNITPLDRLKSIHAFSKVTEIN